MSSGDGFSIAFTHNSLFESPWEEVRSHTIATERTMGTNPYGKAAWVYQFDGDMDEMADSLRIQLAQDVAQHFDRKLYNTGVATTEEERQAEAEKKLLALGVTVGSPQKEAQQKDKERDDAFKLMPKAIEKSLPRLYTTEKELLGDRTAYARYFFPAGAYTAYLLEYDPKERIGFGAVTMGYGWELGNISIDEMEEVRVRGLRIERDLYFSPTKLHQIEELEELVQGHFTKEALQAEERPTEEQDKGQRALPDEEVAPEGVPALTLFRQYEEPERRPDVEAPREMNGQTVYFDDDHHPIMQASHEQEELLFAPEEYTLWTLEVGRVSAELKANTPKHSPSSQKAHTETKAQTPRRRKQPARDTLQGASLFDFTDEPGQDKSVSVSEHREVFDTSPRPFLSAPDSHLRDGSIVVQKGQVGYLSDLKRRPTFHPMDLPLAQLTRLRAYIEIRESYHRLYDYEATNHAEDKEEREKLNRLYDAYVARWGELNKKAKTDVIKMDATGLEMLFLERSIDGHFVKADIFDHPTAFSSDELSIASDPLEALGASLNKYGSVELSFMASLLPEMEESDIISALEGRLYYNPEAGGYEVADKFISGNVIEKANRLASWLLDHPDHEEGKQSLAALMAARPRPIPFADLDFNLGERWIPAPVYGEFASDFFGTDIRVAYHANMDEYTITCDRKNGNIWHKYAVQGEFRRYDGLHLLKHALHNTIPDINKSKEVIDPSSGETKSIKVRDGEKIQQANSKIEEIRQAFVDWLTRRPETFKEQLTDRYNELFNCFVRPSFDGAHQSFPDLDLKRLGIPDLYKSQKDAVWMLKTNGGGICDHEVGAGKTLIMCTAAYEMKRLGLANKPMIIGLKANVFDIADTFRKAYPNARILYPGKDDFTKQNRQRIFADIKNNDWDCIILTHEQFGMIPQALEIQHAILQKEMDSVEENLDVLRREGKDISRGMLKGLEKRKQTLEVKLRDI